QEAVNERFRNERKVAARLGVILPEQRKDPVARALSLNGSSIDLSVNLLCSSGEHPTGAAPKVKRSVGVLPAICGKSLPAAARLRPLRQVVGRAEGIGDPMLAPMADQEHVRVTELGPALRA